jgi:PAS domain S-box-containing protein
MFQISTIHNTTNLTSVINSVPIAIVMVDANGQIVLVNKQTELLFRYSSEQLLGEQVELLVPYRFRSGHPEMRNSYFRNPIARPMGMGRDLFGLRRDGTEFPIEIGLSPIHTNDGLFIVSAIVDITERKRLEARFRATVESAPTAMIMVDPAGTMVLVNRETAKIFGYNQEELLGAKVETLIPDRFRSNHPQLRTDYFADPEARPMGKGRDLYGLRKDGTEFPVEIGLNPLRTDEGAFILAAILDLTTRKKAEEQLRRSNEALEVSNLELQQFAYIASHDLQTPLRAIGGYAEFLKRDYQGKLGEDADNYLIRIVDGVQRMHTLVNDLLSYSRVESQSRPFTDVSLQDSFEDARLMLEASINEVGCEVTCGSLPTVSGDRAQLAQLLQNLIGNAVKYHANESPRVRVSAELQDERWLVSVNDNGIGIPVNQRERIFEIFKRLHSQEAYPGTGIGLAVCRRIVHRHGGKIWAESEPGQGSTFYFTLPAKRSMQVDPQ